mmetsp:Transcript_88251/g.189420  ORF Transcript_88251/g.189420 Transcript_88251/m.189420 type:complete len:221 (+) Transcript_88251:498-1160(+)
MGEDLAVQEVADLPLAQTSGRAHQERRRVVVGQRHPRHGDVELHLLIDRFPQLRAFELLHPLGMAGMHGHGLLRRSHGFRNGFGHLLMLLGLPRELLLQRLILSLQLPNALLMVPRISGPRETGVGPLFRSLAHLLRQIPLLLQGLSQPHQLGLPEGKSVLEFRVQSLELITTAPLCLLPLAGRLQVLPVASLHLTSPSLECDHLLFLLLQLRLQGCHLS